MKWSIFGGGQMGRALVGGMLQGRVVPPEDLNLVEPSAESRAWWAEHHREIEILDPKLAMESSEVVLLAVKPGVISSLLSETDTSGKLVISIAAGVKLDHLQHDAGHGRVVRVMPNTPCLVGEGASAFCGGPEVTDTDRELVSQALSAVGMVVEVSENQMDAVTGLSGSGPAYICLVIEALADGGVAAGLPRRLAMELATQTVLGTAVMVRQTGQHPAQLKDAVASPGGTTIAGLQALEHNGLRAALIEAVTTAANRSKALG